MQVVFFIGVQLDITKVESSQQSSSESTARETSSNKEQPKTAKQAALDRVSQGSRDVKNALEKHETNQKASRDMAANTDNLMESLRTLSTDIPLASRASGNETLPQPKECIGPQEKQMQRSIVGKVSFSPFGNEQHGAQGRRHNGQPGFALEAL